MLAAISAVSTSNTNSGTCNRIAQVKIQSHGRLYIPKGQADAQARQATCHERTPSHESIAAESVASMDDWNDSGFGVDSDGGSGSMSSPRHNQLLKDDRNSINSSSQGNIVLSMVPVGNSEPASQEGPRKPQHQSPHAQGKQLGAAGPSLDTLGNGYEAAACSSDVLLMLQRMDIISAMTTPTGTPSQASCHATRCHALPLLAFELQAASAPDTAAVRASETKHTASAASARHRRPTATTQQHTTAQDGKRGQHAAGTSGAPGVANNCTAVVPGAGPQAPGVSDGHITSTSMSMGMMLSVVYDPVLKCAFQASSDMDIPGQYYVLQ